MHPVRKRPVAGVWVLHCVRVCRARLLPVHPWERKRRPQPWEGHRRRLHHSIHRLILLMLMLLLRAFASIALLSGVLSGAQLVLLFPMSLLHLTLCCWL